MVKGHDGMVAFLNGEKVSMVNMLQGSEITYNSLALSSFTFNQMIIINAANGLDKLRNGENEIAVEMHTSNSTDPQISFDAQLINDKNQKIFSLGSDWYFYDGGDTPPSQISDKVTGVTEKDKKYKPEKVILYNNYPNPFNPSTMISYQLSMNSPQDGVHKVTLKVFDILGKEVTTLVNEKKSSGYYTINWNAGEMLSGVYFAQLRVNEFSKTIKLILTK